IVCLSIAAIAASGFGIWYAAQPHVLNINGPTPLLEFEVKPSTGQSIESLAKVEPELDTPLNRMPMPGYWHTDAPENSGVRAGYVELYFRTSKRLFVVKYPGFTRDIVSFGLLKSVHIDDGEVKVQLALATNDPNVPAAIKNDAESALREIKGVRSAKVLIDIHAPPAGAGAGMGAMRIPGIKHVFAVASGKGGVG